MSLYGVNSEDMAVVVALPAVDYVTLSIRVGCIDLGAYVCR